MYRNVLSPFAVDIVDTRIHIYTVDILDTRIHIYTVNVLDTRIHIYTVNVLDTRIHVYTVVLDPQVYPNVLSPFAVEPP